MRLGYAWGGPGGKSPGSGGNKGGGNKGGGNKGGGGGSHDRGGRQHRAAASSHQAPTAPNIGVPGGGDKGMHHSMDDRRGQHIQNQIQTDISKLGAPPGMNTASTYEHQQPKFNLLDYAPFIGDKSLSGMAVRGLGKGIKSLGNLFKGSGWDSSMGPREDMGYNPNRINPFQQPHGGGGDGQGQQQYYPPWWEEDQYAQNILEDEEELDIDTSTGDMDEWIQRFKVKDPYRQDRGALDEQIREYVSKLYT